MALTSIFHVVHNTAADRIERGDRIDPFRPAGGQHRAGRDDDDRAREVGDEVQTRGPHGDRLVAVVVADEQHAATVDDDRQDADDHHRDAVDGFRIGQTRIDSITIHATEPSSSSAETKPPSASALPETERPRRRSPGDGRPARR